jgi:hypothetical protein
MVSLPKFREREVERGREEEFKIPGHHGGH